MSEDFQHVFKKLSPEGKADAVMNDLSCLQFFSMTREARTTKVAFKTYVGKSRTVLIGPTRAL